MNKTYLRTVSIPDGYYLEFKETKGYLSVLIPEVGINYVHNPTMVNLDGDSIPDGYNIFAVPFTQEDNGAFWDTSWNFSFTSINQYVQYVLSAQSITGPLTGSIWAKSNNNAQITLYIQSTSGVSSQTYTLTDKWQQYSITIPYANNKVSSNISIVVRSSVNIAQNVQLSAFQLENSVYPTSFIYGFLNDNQKWLGTPFASNSKRGINDICSGQTVNLKDLGISLVEFIGGGIPQLDHITRPLVFDFGSIFDCITLESREYEMTFLLHSCSLEDLMCKRNKIGKAIFTLNQPRCWVWTPTECDIQLSEPVCFTAVLEDGFNLGLTSHFGEEIELNLVGYDVAIKRCMPSTCSFSIAEDIAHSGIIGVDNNDIPTQLPAFPNPTMTQIDAATISPYDSNLYVAVREGVFAPFVGVILSYNGQSWTEIARVSTNNVITALEANAQYLWVGTALQSRLQGSGAFTGLSGNGVARINLATQTVNNVGNISPLVTTGADGIANVQPRVNAFTFDQFGNTYIGGAFANFSDLSTNSTFSHIATYTSGGLWSAPNFDLFAYTGNIRDVYYDKDALRLYIGGDFRSLPITTAGIPQIFGYVQFSASDTDYGVRVRSDFPLKNDTDGQVSTNLGEVNAITKYGNRIFLGGHFESSYGYDLGLLRNLAWYDENFTELENAEGRLAAPSLWGVSSDLAESTGIETIEPIEDLAVCNGELFIAGKFDTIGQTSAAFVFHPLGSACGYAKYIKTGSNADTGFITPGGIQVGFNAGAIPVLQCYGDAVLCGNENVGFNTLFINTLVSGVVGANTSELTTSNNCALCEGELPVKPIIHLVGPMILREIRNNTYNISLYFNETLLSGEIITIDLTLTTPTVYSTFRQLLPNAFLSGSNPTGFKLFPGDNYISVYTDTNSSTTASKAIINYNRAAFAIETLTCSDCN